MTDRKPTCVACKGAGSANYIAGTGIVIEDKEISADTSVLATKAELPDMDDYQPKLTAGEGITINDNVISAIGGGEWAIVDSTDLSGFINSNKLTEDIIVVRIANDSNTKCVGTIFLPKDLTITNLEIDFPFYTTTGKGYGIDRIQLSGIFTSTGYVSYNHRFDNINYDTTSRKLSINYGENYAYNYTKQTTLVNTGVVLLRRV